MKRFVVFMLIAVVSLAASASAFDGARKGFVLGGGIGFAPVARFDWFLWDANRSGLALNLIAGYAWSETNMIVYEGNLAFYRGNGIKMLFGQGFNGPCWYHYFGPCGKSLFTAAGLGIYVFRSEHPIYVIGERFSFRNNPGPGLLAGAGYEFARHWQIGGYISGGWTYYWDYYVESKDMSHLHVSILVSGIAF